MVPYYYLLGAVLLPAWCYVLVELRSAVLLALALLVAQVFADHHDSPVPTDHLALVADLLDARIDLHHTCCLVVGGSVVEQKISGI